MLTVGGVARPALIVAGQGFEELQLSSKLGYQSSNGGEGHEIEQYDQTGYQEEYGELDGGAEAEYTAEGGQYVEEEDGEQYSEAEQYADAEAGQYEGDEGEYQKRASCWISCRRSR